MINISNCPISGLERKIVSKRFIWSEDLHNITISCRVSHFKEGNKFENSAIKSFTRDLVASDSLVNPSTGVVLTPEQITAYQTAKQLFDTYPARLAAYQESMLILTGEALKNLVEPQVVESPGPAPIKEYDFYVYVLGVQPIILPQLITQIILLRDSEGKFNI